MKSKSLKQIAEIISGHSFRTGIKDDSLGSTLVLQSADIDRSLKADPDRLKAISDADCPQGSTASLQQNDVILTARASSAGGFKAAIFGQCNKRVIASSSVYILRLHDASEILPEFLALYFISHAGNAELAKITTSGAIRTILKKDVSDIPIPIPDMAIQKTLVQLYENIQTQKSVLATKIHLNNNIIEGAFQQLLT